MKPVIRFFPLLSLLAFGGFVEFGRGADLSESVNSLIPKLANPEVPARYAAQMELQQLAANASKPGSGPARAEFAKLLAAKAADSAVPQPARVWLVRQIEYMGGAETVSALTQILSENDAELRECARRALEKNPAPEAGASLSAALQKGGDATWKIGLMSALGQRHDAEAAALIIPQLDDTQTTVRAALALGRIGTPAAVEALWKHLGQNAAAADGLIIAANQLAANANAPSASEIYKKLYQQTTLGVSARAAALAGLAAVAPAAAAPFIPQALNGTEARLHSAAVLAAPAALGKDCSSTLAGLMPRLSPPVKELVLNVLDGSAEKLVIETTKDADSAVRVAAIEALGRMGGAQSVPVLLAVGTADARTEKTAAATALAKVSGAGAGEAIAQAASAGDNKVRILALDSLTARKQVTAMPVVLRCAEDADQQVRRTAFGALGRLASDKDLDALINLAAKSKSAEACSAIEATVPRVENKPAAAQKLLALATDEATQLALLDALSELGGPDVLNLMAKLTASASEETRLTAIKAMGNWPDLTATKPLLALAGSPDLKESIHKQILQSVVRLIKEVESKSTEDLASAALAAWNLSRTDEEKKLVLSAIAFVPHPKAVATLKPLLADPALKTDAGQAGLVLAELLMKSNPALGKEMAQAVRDANISSTLTRQANRLLR